MLWGGLAISDHMSVHPAIGSPDDFKALAKHLHDKDMKLLTWFNPSHEEQSGKRARWSWAGY